MGVAEKRQPARSGLIASAVSFINGFRAERAMGGRQTAHESLLPFRDPEVLEHLIASTEVFYGADWEDLLWHQFYQEIWRQHPDDARAMFGSTACGHAYHNKLGNRQHTLWVSARLSPLETRRTIVHEFLHVYEYELQDAFDDLHSNGEFTSEVYDLIGASLDPAWEPLYREGLPERLVETEARLVLRTAPYVVSRLREEYPRLFEKQVVVVP